MRLNDLRDFDGFLYLATVYTRHEAGLNAACKEACDLAGRLMQRGIPVFCPIAHTHPIAMVRSLDPVDHEFWMRADRPMMRAARGLLVATMDGWTRSRGITEEIAEFAKAGKPMWTVDPLTLAVDPLK